jgi:ferric-dicitrate binding protein FerR (iron transport regulator)
MSDCLSMRERHFAPDAQGPLAPEWVEHLRVCAECRTAFEEMPAMDRALAEIARAPVSVPSFDMLALPAASAARKQRRRQSVRRSVPYLYTGVATAAVATAAVLAITILGGHEIKPDLLLPGKDLQVTGEPKLRVLGSGARLRLETGAIKLTSASKQKETLVLDHGRVLLEVPKLAPGVSLAVRTPDAEVRVHGTRFEVFRTENETRVHVTEGVVEVRPEGIGRSIQFLRTGESTTVGSAEAHREALRRATLAALDHGQFAAAEREIGTLLGSNPDAPQRAEAQALLAWSIAARGARAEAIQRYRQALALLPEGLQPLWAENACAELALLIEHENSPKSAAPTWAECLRRFPEGVHSGLARSRVRSSKGP